MQIASYVKSFLLENKTTKQTLIKNTLWLTLSSFVGRILGAILAIYIVRFLGPTEYGKFAFALAFVSLFVSFLDFGISPIATREFAKDKKKEEYFDSLLSLKILLGFGTVALIIISSYFITADSKILDIIRILALFTFLSQLPEFVYSFLTAREKFEHISWLSIVQVILTVAIGLFVAIKFPSAKNISYAYLFSSFLALFPVFIFFHLKVFPLKLSFNVNVWKKFLMLSWPLALISIFTLIYGYIDSIIMGFLGKVTEVGYYSAASKVALFITTPAGLITSSFYPVLSRLNGSSPESFKKASNSQTLFIIFLILPIVLLSIIFAPQIINFFYGVENYTPSIFAFQILTLAIGVSAVYRSFNMTLIVANEQKKVLFITILGAIANTILNLILIPRFSFYGAAFASLSTHLLLFVLYLFLAKKMVFKKI